MAKKKYFIHCETDTSGTDKYELIEAESLEEAEVTAREMGAENYQDYEYLFEDDKNDAEESGIEYIEGEHWDYSVEEYNPKEHNDYLWDDCKLKEKDK